MRLSDYLIRPISTSTQPSGQYNKQLEVYNLAVNLINRMTHPIPSDTDQEGVKAVGVEVKRTGEWVRRQNIARTDDIDILNLLWRYECSECTYEVRSMTRYCPNCGAEMRAQTR